MKFYLKDVLLILENTPKTVRNILQDLPEEWLFSNEGPDTWSPFDIVGHLIHGEKTDWIPRAKIIMSGLENRQFEPFDRFAQYENSKGKSMEELLVAFEDLRKENLKTLAAWNLIPSDYNLTGFHPEFGEVSLSQLLATWVVHDLNHINQMTRVMAKNYKEEVGPWTRYIKVLNY